MRLAGAWITIIGVIAGLAVIAKDQPVLDTIFTDNTKLLATAMGGNAYG